MSEMLTNLGLVEHAKKMLEVPTSYMWGTLNRKIDSGMINWCKNTYPTMYSADRIAYLTTQIGKRYGCDCVGLIKSYYFGGIGSPNYIANKDYNTNSMYAVAIQKGAISSLPETPGTCLYMKGHVGIYIGNGKAIECTLGQYGDGVVMSNVKGRGWTHWYNCPFVKYPDATFKPDIQQTSLFKKGDLVQVKPCSMTYTGGALALYVYSETYNVIEITGDRVVIGKGNIVTAAIHQKNLMKR